MSWWRRFLREPGEERQAQLRAVRERFGSFSALLDGNKRVLKVIADMEEKSQGEHLFDINYIRSSREALREGVAGVVERMVALGGERYAPLRERLGRLARLLLEREDHDLREAEIETVPARPQGRHRLREHGR